MTDGDRSVLVVSQYFPPETGAGPSRWDELTKRWDEDADVTVLTSAPDYPEGELYEGYDNGWVRREDHNGVEVLHTKTVTAASGNLPRRSLKFVWFMLLAIFVGLRYTSPTVVVATSPQPLTGVSAWIIARFQRATFVFEVRDFWPQSILSVSDFDNRLIIWTIDRVVRFLYRRSDRLVVLSKAFTDPIAECGIERSKIAYHPNGVDSDLYENPPADADGPDVLDDRFTVSYVGTIGRAHGLSVVLEAAPRLPNVHFLLVGTGAEHDELRERASDLDNVTFTGRRPKAEVPHVLAASNAALVHLKPREIFETVIPSKLLEAMAAGLPVVLGVRGEAERILTAADAGIPIQPGDPEDLVDAVAGLEGDPELCTRFGDNGREYVVRHFDWDTIAREYLSTITAQ
jgi:glycosyltransferase involved in cell wall biosynthesis